MLPIYGSDLAKQFYVGNKCIKELEIEKIFDATILQIIPNATVKKVKVRNGTTDGIFQFYDECGNIKFWTLQECKRNIGSNSVVTLQAFIQVLFYLGNFFYYDTSAYGGLDKFKGAFIDSARFFWFIPKVEFDLIMNDFEYLFNKYFRVRPSEAHIIPDVYDWSLEKFNNIQKKINILDNDFRFDLFIKDLYENKI